ncbi:MAG: hypothetical protein ABR572_08115 [Cryomorphaceae bacterium]
MEKQQGYMTIKAIAERLSKMSDSLEAGQLTADEIMEMHALSGQLYERMVILRFKAFEEEGAADFLTGKGDALPEKEEVPTAVSEPEAAPEAPPAAAEETVEAPPVADAKPMTDETRELTPDPEPNDEPAEASATGDEERPAFRFGKPASEVAPNQISLIDSIEEIKRMERSINDQFKTADSKTLAQKLEQTPVPDLKSAIGINLRFRFVSVLFKNDNEAYSAAVEKLNNFNSLIEADEYIQNSLMDQFDWEKKNPAVKQFIGLVERRYL